MRQLTCMTALVAALLFLAFDLKAIDADEGRVTMQGAIISASCAIDAGDQVQSIQMLTTPLHLLIQQNSGIEQELEIKLTDCQLDIEATDSSDHYFQMVFDGNSEGQDFTLDGDAQGIALRITDESGSIVVPGQPVKYKLHKKNATLHYKINITGNSQQLQTGNYHALIKFNLSYH